ncbi:hypothetical protein LOTGIDRAFT_220165 [Lottia gigantea]|uniref:Gamma-glutamyltransferase n=1 Tax=Lottia gigantea TaxID=225164 RepID=V4A2E2_LOTGI|nr:hypothetical protein LOTGIDRAFT_220165 [Lottia gigantea]ESO87456.1 hypothetical protein LOTGIDRAFT_220165 [Lottia gigantea]
MVDKGDEYIFNSRKSPIVCQHGIVSTNQPLASQIGLDILKAGGNAADAAIAVAAALNVTEPCSTGMGGDAFCLFYEANSKTVKGLNGSGRAPKAATLELFKSCGYTPDNPMPMRGGLSVTVPGAAAAWVDTVQHFGSGKISLVDILQPAINLAENGFPVQQTVAHFWAKGSSLLKDPENKHGQDMLLDGEAPKHGQVIKLPKMAQTFKEVAKYGKKGFYEGRIAQAVVDVVNAHGGVMSLEDLASHRTTYEEPISVDYKGHRVWEIAPSGQGLVALLALNILDDYDLRAMEHNSGEYLHHVIEAIRLGFADGLQYIADPSMVNVPIKELLSKKYAKERRKHINSNRTSSVIHGSPYLGSDTTYFSITDAHGNACSFINSNFMGFGTGLVPEGCGFTLQNRGYGFSLEPDHPNRLEPGKRPYHTIIPAMITSHDTALTSIFMNSMNEHAFLYAYMNMWSYIVVLLNMVEFGMNPQQAIDAPRFCVGGGYGCGNVVSLEEGIQEDTIRVLKDKGHNVEGPLVGYDRSLFGRGHVIAKGDWWRGDTSSRSDVWWGGCDPRTDSSAVGF